MPPGQPYTYTATVWSFGERATIGSGLTRHLAAHGGAVTAVSSELAVVVLHTGLLKNLTWSCTGNGLTGLKTVLTVHVNGTATALAASWPPGVTSGAAVKGEVAVKQGDVVSMRIQTPTGSGSIARPRASVELVVPMAIPWLSSPKGMYYDSGGGVGIGTDSPAERFSVNGMIQSMSGGFRFPDGSVQATAVVAAQVVTPPGSVIAYAGASAPAGWLLCDGSLVDRAAYADLFAAIGNAHGEGDGSTTFALPDCRGMFLRGVSGDSGGDPDAASRTAARPGGNAGNTVGSKQSDLVLSHLHKLGVGVGDSFTMVQGYDPANTGRLAGFNRDAWNDDRRAHTTEYWPPHAELGSETRPRNISVNYLIKT